MSGSQKIQNEVKQASSKDFLEYIHRYSSFLILTHRSPDGDAVGSSLALAHYLLDIGKTITVLDQDPIPERLRFLPGADLFQTAESYLQTAQGRAYEAIIALDAADLQQLGSAGQLIEPDLPVFNLDHHITNTCFGHHNLVPTDAASCTEVLYRVFQSENIQLTFEISICLYTGLISDTGGFRHGNTTRSVHLMAADLIGYGIDPFQISQDVLFSRTLRQVRFTANMLPALQVDPAGKVAWFSVTRKLLSEFDAVEDDLQDLIDFPRSIDSVEVAILYKEQEEGKVKVSLRSKYYVDVAAIAKSFGGGGHKRAAGCTLQLPIQEAMEQVFAAVERNLRS